jgi:NAD(P)-dependent dehydrogenase (short-subunit alcohol dehydrogenase family)
LPLLREAGTEEDPARVINIGSMSGILTISPLTTAYEASKAALHHLSKVLGGNLAPQHINVNTVAYGYFHTDMMKGTADAVGDALFNNIPMNRSGKPEEAAGVCLFLSSRASAYITGATISVDGGAVTGGKNML